jgi:ribonuclease BN (tRNA processing enzyme)
VRITVLGKSPAWQDADGACSGYLVEDEGARLLVDCGNGVFSKLRRYGDYRAVDAVVISHLHADHFLDLVPFAYALTYAPGPPRETPPLLYAPGGATQTFRRVVGAWGNEDLIERAFDVREYRAEDVLQVGRLEVRFQEVPHYTTSHAIAVRSADGGGRFAFGADMAPNEALVRFAAGAELLLIEATLLRPEEEGPRGHLTAAEAGDHGARAGVRRLVLTHMTDELDEDSARREAERTVGAPVSVAREGALYSG